MRRRLCRIAVSAVHIGAGLVFAGALLDGFGGCSGVVSLRCSPDSMVDRVVAGYGRTVRFGFVVSCADAGGIPAGFLLRFSRPVRTARGAAVLTHCEKRVSAGGRTDFGLWRFEHCACPGVVRPGFEIFEVKYRPGRPVVFAGIWLLIVSVPAVCMCGGGGERQ